MNKLIDVIEHMNNKMNNDRFDVYIGIQDEYMGEINKYTIFNIKNIEGQNLELNQIDSRVIKHLNNTLNSDILINLFNAIITAHDVLTVTFRYHNYIDTSNKKFYIFNIEYTISLLERTDDSDVFSSIVLSTVYEYSDSMKEEHYIKAVFSSADGYNELTNEIHNSDIYESNPKNKEFDSDCIMGQINNGITNIIQFVNLGFIFNLKLMLEEIYLRNDHKGAKKILDALSNDHKLNCDNHDNYDTVLKALLNF